MLRSSNAVIYVVISVNRYYAVMNPLKYSLKFTPTIAYRVCCGILFISVLIWSPLALGSFHFLGPHQFTSNLNLNVTKYFQIDAPFISTQNFIDMGQGTQYAR